MHDSCEMCNGTGKVVSGEEIVDCLCVKEKKVEDKGEMLSELARGN